MITGSYIISMFLLNLYVFYVSSTELSRFPERCQEASGETIFYVWLSGENRFNILHFPMMSSTELQLLLPFYVITTLAGEAQNQRKVTFDPQNSCEFQAFDRHTVLYSLGFMKHSYILAVEVQSQLVYQKIYEAQISFSANFSSFKITNSPGLLKGRIQSQLFPVLNLM